jgi:sugar phosphate isomerase/epimerase
LDPEIVLEVDTYWAAAGGEDVPELLSRLGDRVRLLHLKDGPIQTNFKDQVPLGQGKMPWKEILAAATSLEVGIVEVDEYTGDMLEAVRESYDYLAALAGDA